MAREWAEVPEYVASLERTLGAERAPEFLTSIEDHAEAMRSTETSRFPCITFELLDAPDKAPRGVGRGASLQ